MPPQELAGANAQLTPRETPDLNPQRVWYASYGSNMDPARFLGYIKGGRVLGMSLDHKGCADNSDPTGAEAIELANSMYFGGDSWHWLDHNGNMTGAAFTTLGRGDDRRPTLAMAYHITLDQFRGVFEQENDDVPRDALPSIDLDRVVASRREDLIPGAFYSTIQYGGELEGDPILSFTGPRRPYNRPSAAYLSRIGGGLMKAHDLSEQAAARYLATTPGALGEVSVMNVARLLYNDQSK